MKRSTLRELIWNEIQPTQLNASEIPRISSKIISQLCSVNFSFCNVELLLIYSDYKSPVTCDSLVDDCEKVINEFSWEIGGAVDSN